MSWHYSRVLVEAYLEDISSDGAQYVPLSGSPIPQAFLSPGRMKAFSRLSQFGMTFSPLTENLGRDVLTWCLGASPVKTLVQQEMAQESEAPEAGCGSIWLESLAKFDPITSSWKIPQCLPLEGLDEFSETWPQWGMMQNGECWERSTPQLLTKEKEFGSWPTPTCHNAIECDAPSEATRNTPTLTHQARGGDKTQPKHLNPMWVEWLMGWPLGWTDLKPLEMDKFQSWQHSHSKFFQHV